MGSNERGLLTSEGVDEASKDSVTESSGGGCSDTMGAPAAGTPDNGEQNAAPEPVGTAEEPLGPGQRNQVGEG